MLLQAMVPGDLTCAVACTLGVQGAQRLHVKDGAKFFFVRYALQ
jgi:hypothetical protein